MVVEWIGLALCLALLLGLGIFLVTRTTLALEDDRALSSAQRDKIVHGRAARPSRTKTDLDVYLRTAWAVRQGLDLYTIRDDNGWHYLYPPLLAIALTPLADPPLTQADASWTAPFPVSMAVWYLVSLLVALIGIELLVRALTLDQPPSVFSRAWVRLRLLTILFCLPVLGRALARGQVGPLVLLALAGMTAALIRKRDIRAGFWLAGAVCIKIIPLFLLLYTLWRRRWSMLTGLTAGLLLGTVLIPMLALGPARTLESFGTLYREVLHAGATSATKVARSAELSGINSTDSNSPQTILHNLMYLGTPKPWPDTPASWIAPAHWTLIALLTLITLAAAGWKMRPAQYDPVHITLLAGALILVHVMASPVSHPHHYTVAAIPVAGLIAHAWRRRGNLSLGWGTEIVLWFFLLAHALTAAGIQILRDAGIVLLAGLLLWLACIVALRQARSLNAPAPA